MNANKTMNGQAVQNHRRRKDKNVESNTDSVHTIKPLNKKRQLNDKNHHILMNINTEC
jgi:hypothetical protein